MQSFRISCHQFNTRVTRPHTPTSVQGSAVQAISYYCTSRQASSSRAQPAVESSAGTRKPDCLLGCCSTSRYPPGSLEDGLGHAAAAQGGQTARSSPASEPGHSRMCMDPERAVSSQDEAAAQRAQAASRAQSLSHSCRDCRLSGRKPTLQLVSSQTAQELRSKGRNLTRRPGRRHHRPRRGAPAAAARTAAAAGSRRLVGGTPGSLQCFPVSADGRAG